MIRPLAGTLTVLATLTLIVGCATPSAPGPAGNETTGNEAPGNESPGSESPDGEGSGDGAPGPGPVVGGPDTAVVQVGEWSHTYAIPDHLSDMCSVQPEFGLLTVRDMRDDVEFFEWKFDEPGYNGVVFGVESPARFYVAGESQAEAYAEALDFFGVTTPVPAVTEAMFEVTSGSAHGSIQMLDILTDSIVSVNIHITCD